MNEQTTANQMDRKSQPPPHEGSLTKAVESQTAKVPSIAFLVLAGLAVAASVGLAATRKDKSMANFIGLWVPSLLLMGIYNKIVKTHGSDSMSPAAAQEIH